MKKYLLPLGVLLSVIFLLCFYLYPMIAIFKLVGSSLLEQGLSAYAWERSSRALVFTFWQAGLSTIFTLLLGLPAAFIFARYRFPGKSLLGVLTILPFILPTIVVAASFNALLGSGGLVNATLMRLFHLTSPPIQVMNSLGMIILAHVFYNTSIIIRVVGTAWSQLDVRIEQAARVLGTSPLQTLLKVTLPLLRPSIFAASLLVFIFDFSSFGVVLLLGGPRLATIEVEIYIQAMHMLNLPLSGLLSAIQIVCTLTFTVIYLNVSNKAHLPLIPRLHGEGLRRPDSWKEYLLITIVLLLLFAILVAPLLSLGWRSITLISNTSPSQAFPTLTLQYYHQLFVNSRNSLFYVPPILAMRNSLLYAAATVCISLVFGSILAYGLVRTGRAARLLDPLIMLPMGTSAVTLGLGFVMVFNRPPLDIRSFPLLIPIAHSLVALPLVVRTLQPALASIPPSLRHAAAVLGASPWHVWKEVEWPIISRAAAISAIFSFTISLGEFGATSFLTRPEIPTLPVAIYRFLSQPGALNYGQAMAMSTLLLIFCALSIWLMERL